MSMDKRHRMVIGLSVLLLLGGGTVGAVVTATVVPRGQAVTYAGDRAGWYCYNGATISCRSGDAEPFATLSKGVITVRVTSLRPACVKRVLRPSPDPTDPQMKPYYEYTYTLKAIGRC
jgi:hypothetical protein